ncbi:hypothetical protein JYT31_03360 [Beggiatoa alba]|nr:hypothetical protein [Beggiatoa alba]
MNISDSFSTLTDVLKGAVGVGMSLAVVFLVVDLLFPGTTNIVGNVASLVSSFTSQGLIGLITLLVFVSLFSRD